MIKRLWASIKAFFYTPVAATESQPKENTVKLALVNIISGVPADGVSKNTVQATLTDFTGGIPLRNAHVNFYSDGSTVTPVSALTDENGQITVSIVSLTAGPDTLTASAADDATGNANHASIQVYFAAVPAPVAISDPDLIKTTPAALTPLEAMKEDFDKVVAFIEHGIEVLGKDAEADLVALKNKFLV